MLPGHIRHQNVNGHACTCELTLVIAVEVVYCLGSTVSQCFKNYGGGGCFAYCCRTKTETWKILITIFETVWGVIYLRLCIVSKTQVKLTECYHSLASISLLLLQQVLCLSAYAWEGQWVVRIPAMHLLF